MLYGWWLWVRTDATRRLRAAIVLLVLVAVAGGVVMGAVAGGRRNGTAVDRATALTSPADALVLLNRPGFDWDRVRALPEVASVAEFAVADVPVKELPQGLYAGFPIGSREAMTEINIGSPTRSTRPWMDGDRRGLIVVGENHPTGLGEATPGHWGELERWAREHFDIESFEYRWSARTT
ncbi:MAG: hypothetical protein ACRD29_03045 [Acidimicrobiales bacterium]